MPDETIVFEKEKSLNGLMIIRGLSRINLVPDIKILPGYAVRQQGNVVNVHPEVFKLITETKDCADLVTIMKGLRVV